MSTNTTSVRRMLDGCQPRWPVPRLVAQVLSRQLHREVSVTACGFADHTPASLALADRSAGGRRAPRCGDGLLDADTLAAETAPAVLLVVAATERRLVGARSNGAEIR